jgi:HEPN domain-containing protein
MQRYESWLERAESSYELSKGNIFRNIYFEDLCYQAQQAVEKAFKGLLIYYGVEPEFTHNIGILLNEIEKYTKIDDTIRESMKLTNFAVQTRYPGNYDDITKEEYKEAIKIAKSCLNWVKKTIKDNENKKT